VRECEGARRRRPGLCTGSSWVIVDRAAPAARLSASTCQPRRGLSGRRRSTKSSSYPRRPSPPQSNSTASTSSRVRAVAKPRDLFGMWAGASFNVEYFVYGVLLISVFGSTSPRRSIATSSATSRSSSSGGKPGKTPDRDDRLRDQPRRIRAQRSPTRPVQLAHAVGSRPKAHLIVFAGEIITVSGVSLPETCEGHLPHRRSAIQLLLPLLGHATMVRTLRLLIAPFVILYGILAALTLGKANFHTVHVVPGGSRSWRRWRSRSCSPASLDRVRQRLLPLLPPRCESQSDRRVGLPRYRGAGDSGHAPRVCRRTYTNGALADRTRSPRSRRPTCTSSPQGSSCRSSSSPSSNCSRSTASTCTPRGHAPGDRAAVKRCTRCSSTPRSAPWSPVGDLRRFVRPTC